MDSSKSANQKAKHPKAKRQMIHKVNKTKTSLKKTKVRRKWLVHYSWPNATPVQLGREAREEDKIIPQGQLKPYINVTIDFPTFQQIDDFKTLFQLKSPG